MDSIKYPEYTAFVDFVALGVAGQLEPTDGMSLKIVDADIFSGMDKPRITQILKTMSTDRTKVAMVVFNNEDKWIGDLAEGQGIVVVRNWTSSPEETAIEKAAISDIISISVLSSIKNIDKWRPGVNTMIRYVVCGNDVTVSGILKLYNKLPEDVKQALASSGITVQTIQRSEVVNTDGRFDVNEVKEGMITEIST